MVAMPTQAVVQNVASNVMIGNCLACSLPMAQSQTRTLDRNQGMHCPFDAGISNSRSGPRTLAKNDVAGAGRIAPLFTRVRQYRRRPVFSGVHDLSHCPLPIFCLYCVLPRHLAPVSHASNLLWCCQVNLLPSQ